jgi:hypothetical protein
MSLAGKGHGRRGTSCLCEARRGGRETHVRLGQMQLPGIMPSSVLIPIALGRVGGRDGKLGVDLV